MASGLANVTLPIARLRFDFEAAADGVLPDLAGPSWRGGFGWALRRLSCPQPDRDPAACPCAGPCAWRLVFDTPRPAGATKMRLYETIPHHPFALDAQAASGRMRAGAPAVLVLTLIGGAQLHARAVVEALALAGEAGIREARTRFRLRAVFPGDRAGHRAVGALRPGARPGGAGRGSAARGGGDERTVRGLARGMEKNFSLSTKSRLIRDLRTGLGPLAAQIVPRATGRRPVTGFILPLPPERIRFAADGKLAALAADPDTPEDGLP